MTTADINRVIPLLRDVASSGRLQGLAIGYWAGGGPPPPLYRSEQMVLYHFEGHDTVEVSRTLFDKKYQPPSCRETFRARAEPAEIRRIAGALLHPPVLSTTYEEETDPHIADI